VGYLKFPSGFTATFEYFQLIPSLMSCLSSLVKRFSMSNPDSDANIHLPWGVVAQDGSSFPRNGFHGMGGPPENPPIATPVFPLTAQNVNRYRRILPSGFCRYFTKFLMIFQAPNLLPASSG